MEVFFKASPKVVPDDLTGHLVLLGGIIWNPITQRLSEMTSLPVRQITDPEFATGDIFEADIDGKKHRFMPEWYDEPEKNLREDVGLLARAPNPLNSNRALDHMQRRAQPWRPGGGTQSHRREAARFKRKYIARNFSDSDSYAILMRVPIIGGSGHDAGFQRPGIRAL